MTVRILTGDVFEQLATLPDESVHCVVTSPPYWNLRDYGITGQIGLEPTISEYVGTMVRVFREVRRVLRRDGTAWVNLGDSMSAGGHGGHQQGQGSNGIFHGHKRRQGDRVPRKATDGLKPKDLCMIPARVALALQEDGWYLRSEIIWAKPNPMPESVTDRPTNSHEKIWFLTKEARYWYDADAVRTEATSVTTKMPDGWDTGPGSHGSVHRQGREKGKRTDKQRGHGRRHAGFNDRWDAMSKEEQAANGANLRNVWNIATRAYSEAHFATFPPEIPERCIKAGCPEGGTVLDPFGGAGTTGLVADRLNRNAILIELNPEYAEMARNRIAGDAPLFADVETGASNA